MDRRTDLPVIAHCASPFLELTTGWIHDQIRLLERYAPVCVTQAVRNVETFPVACLVDASGTGMTRLWRRAVRKVRGTYAGYGDILKASGAALVHAHFGQEGFRCLVGKRAAAVPLVTTFYGLDVSVLPRQKPWRDRFARLFAEGDLFLAEGAHMAQCLVDLGCAEDRVRVQKLGVDLSRIPFRAPLDRDAPRQILMYASLREKKGHVYGLRAIARVADGFPEMKVTVIGDGPLRADLEDEVRRLGIEDRVQFMGMLPHAACIERLGEATVLLYPSVTASDGDTEGGAPVGLIEAMGAGLPIVSTRHADIPNVVTDGTCGLLADERDVDALAEALNAVLGDGAMRQRLAVQARARVEQEHELTSCVRKLERVYDTLRGT